MVYRNTATRDPSLRNDEANRVLDLRAGFKYGYVCELPETHWDPWLRLGIQASVILSICQIHGWMDVTWCSFPAFPSEFLENQHVAQPFKGSASDGPQIAQPPLGCPQDPNRKLSKDMHSVYVHVYLYVCIYIYIIYTCPNQCVKCIASVCVRTRGYGSHLFV